MWSLTLLCLNTLMYQHCLGQDVIGEAGEEYHVATEFAEVVTVVVGGTAVLPCARTPNNSDTVVWIGLKSELLAVDDKLTQDGRLIRVVREFPDVSTLQIKDVKFEDQGIYKCQIISERPIVKQIFLVVQIPPKIHIQGTEWEIYVNEGEVGILHCTASGVPPPTVSWYKISGETRTALKKNGEVYNIVSMSESDAGNYECEASNGVSSTVRRQFLVNYKPYPSFYDTDKVNITVQEGETAVLPCFVRNLGKFKVSWYEGIYLIASGTHTVSKRYSIDRLSSDDYSLKIDPVHSFDANVYKCRINRDQLEEKVVKLEVEGGDDLFDW